MEYRLRRADGEYRWVLDSGTPRFSSREEFLGYIGSCIDITDRKEAEEELRRAHDELNQLKNQLRRKISISNKSFNWTRPLARLLAKAIRSSTSCPRLLKLPQRMRLF